MSKFDKPKFGNRAIELRFENDEVCIYATQAGLVKIIEFCKSLLNEPGKGHVHLEGYEVLTINSKKGVIASFDKVTD